MATRTSKQEKAKQQSVNRAKKVAYKALAEKGGETRSAKRARLKKRRSRTVLRGAHLRPCGNIACRTCYMPAGKRR